MFTANDARRVDESELDRKIEAAVREGERYGARRASIRVYIDDPWIHTIKAELEKRGFINVDVPDICLKGDVEFEWSGDDEPAYR